MYASSRQPACSCKNHRPCTIQYMQQGQHTHFWEMPGPIYMHARPMHVCKANAYMQMHEQWLSCGLTDRVPEHKELASLLVGGNSLLLGNHKVIGRLELVVSHFLLSQTDCLHLFWILVLLPRLPLVEFFPLGAKKTHGSLTSYTKKVMFATSFLLRSLLRRLASLLVNCPASLSSFPWPALPSVSPDLASSS